MKDILQNFAENVKVASATKHRNTAKEIIIYTHRVYSFLLKLKKTKHNTLTFIYTPARLGMPTSLLTYVQFISH